MAKTKLGEELFEEEAENVQDVAEAVMLESEPLVHTMMRSIATTALPIGGAKTIQQVDAEVGAWIARGYRLVNAQFIGSEPNAVLCVYFLEKTL